MKTQRSDLEKHIAVPDRYDSLLSFPVNKGGYSGVAVYTSIETVAPLKAEEGLSGTLQPKPSLSAEERISSSYPQAHQMNLFADENDQTPSSLALLDAEGRALVVDFGLFVLINVYCPAETSETRLPYKMNFHLLLEERIRKLINEEGREVVVVGDLNVTATPIDHCDGHLPSYQANFWDHPPRTWLKNWLSPSGPMIDVIRDAWPDRKGMFTCWNTKISARETNYGTRLDYILLTRGLLPWFKHGDIQPSIRGSDHCPIFVDLHDEIELEPGKVVRLRDAMKYDDGRQKPPRISPKCWKEFSGNQRLLSSFFTKKNSAEARKSGLEPSASVETVELDDSPRDSTLDMPLSQPSDSPSIDDRNSSSRMSQAQRSSNNLLERRASSSRKRKNDSETGQQAEKKKQKAGQTTLSSFFASHKTASLPSDPGSSSLPVDPANVPQPNDTESGEAKQVEADHILARSLSEISEPSAPSPSSSQSRAAWTQLMAPLQPPKCKVHGEPCKEFTVNKAGPNKGKTFFLCSRPVGPGYDKGRSGRLREEVDEQYQCSFFKWASEVKKESMRNFRKGSANGSSSGKAESDDTRRPR